jgi:hypothetical protein
VFNNDSPDKNESNSITVNVSLWKVVALFRINDIEIRQLDGADGRQANFDCAFALGLCTLTIFYFL